MTSFPKFPGEIDRKLVFDFFWKFSVFECALKQGGFLKKAGREPSRDAGFGSGDRQCTAQPHQRKAIPAEADWDTFGNAIKDDFSRVASPGFQEAVTKIIGLSPKKQVIDKDGKLDFQPVKQGVGESKAAYSLHLLRIARNNLFHGGKYPDGGPSSIAPRQIVRDQEILRAASIILDGCYELHPAIKQSIDEVAAGSCN